MRSLCFTKLLHSLSPPFIGSSCFGLVFTSGPLEKILIGIYLVARFALLFFTFNSHYHIFFFPI